MLLNNGIAVVQANFIETKAIAFTLAKINQTLLFTSQNAVESVLQNPQINQLKKHNAICVGVRTKALLEAHGFTVLASEDYAANLVPIIKDNFSKTSFTFFAGNIRRDTLPNAFNALNIEFDEITVYQTTANPQKITTSVDGILFYSPSGVNSYLHDNTLENQMCFCIGTTTAEAVHPYQNIVIARQQTVENTVVQCINHFKNKPQS